MLDGRPKGTGELPGERRDIGLRVGRLCPARFDARKIEQSVHQLQQSPGIAVQDVHLRTLRLAEPPVRICEKVFGRAEHQRERRSELVTDIAEEGRLRAIDLGQRFGAAPRLLEGHGIADGGRNVIGRQLEEVPVSIVERAARADAGDQDAVGVVETGPRQRQQDRCVRVFLVRPSGQRAETPRGTR